MKQRFRVPFRIIDRVMRVPGLAQMLEVGARIFDEALVKRAKILRTESERIAAEEVVKESPGMGPSDSMSTMM